MQINDIVNRDLVNLVNCESEPIHIPGSIQPHGFLLAVTQGSGVIAFCSGNCDAFIQMKPEAVLGRTITDIFGEQQARDYNHYITKDAETSHPFVFSFNDIQYNTTVHKSNDVFVLELEPFPDGTLDLPNLYDQTRKFVSLMEGTSYLIELCRDIAMETRRLTGYDRVMIYRFDQEYNGEVIAEAKRDDLESFSGQKYPHTDIPVQARELYICNKMRMIADVNYTPVPIYTSAEKDTHDHSALDLSLSVLRSVSPIHIQYLKNMGVGSTLTVSLILNKKLWGLIACHHYSPKVLPHYSRLSALLQGNFLTSQVNVREIAEEFDLGRRSVASLTQLLEKMKDNDEFINEFPGILQVKEIANATGAILYYDEKVYSNGIVPDTDKLLQLVRILSESKAMFHTTSLSSMFPETQGMAAEASGVIYHSLSENGSDCIMWLRQEMVETINWAGNPNEAINKTEDNRLTPRKSFDLWVEEVRYKSREWRASELSAAASFAYALQKYINLDISRKQEQKLKELNEDLLQANKELANINWISTHDLREPLRKIRILSSRILDVEGDSIAPGTKDAVDRMSAAAIRMQNLINDVLSYSKVGSMEKVFEKCDLDDLVMHVMNGIADEVKDSGAEVGIDELPVINGIPFQLKQLFQNLLLNAIKFHQPGKAPVIEITVDTVSGKDAFPNSDTRAMYYHIQIVDQGIGFNHEYHEKIFEVFQRLHAVAAYKGSGVGLAICRKIMQNHKGYISASSEVGKGSVFHLWFGKGDFTT